MNAMTRAIFGFGLTWAVLANEPLSAQLVTSSDAKPPGKSASNPLVVKLHQPAE